MRTFILAALSLALMPAPAEDPRRGPVPFSPVPTPRQLKWHQLETYGFLHFSINTFTDKEWGYGDESPALFNPADFDAAQIVRTAREAGMKGLVLTAKHHDGFCLWPSKFTEHSVKNSPWKNGRGDVVREISNECRRQGLKFGVYLSPWDRNHSQYGRPAYIAYYRGQLRELLTQYGPIFEVWFDGANGGDGYYGGARETRRIDNRTYYDWPNTWAMVRELQPEACMFSDAGPDVRWVGNEAGYAGDPCWATINPEGTYPGHADPKVLNRGDRPGTHWIPAEVDVSIRPGWFFHASEDANVKSVDHLLRIYHESVGRGANLILNIPPDRRGRIPDKDAETLREWGRALKQTFARDLARGSRASASNVRSGDRRFAAANAVDGRAETYWAADDSAANPEIVLDLRRAVTFNVVRIREYLPLGQRIDRIALDHWDASQWKPFAEVTSIGSQRLIRAGLVTSNRIRLRILESRACPALSEISLFREPSSRTQTR